MTCSQLPAVLRFNAFSARLLRIINVLKHIGEVIAGLFSRALVFLYFVSSLAADLVAKNLLHFPI